MRLEKYVSKLDKSVCLTCSYLQTTSSHFVPRFVSPSKSKILSEYMSKIWQSPKCLANAVPKPASVQLEHEANLGVESIKALNLFVSLQNRLDNQQCANTDEDNFASCKCTLPKTCQKVASMAHLFAKTDVEYEIQ